MMSRVVAVFLLLSLVAPVARALPRPEDPLPTDPAVRRGTLANGLTYYIRANHKPENRAELRLVVNAGSVLEEDDQQGLAHFLEHMAFNGTKSFPPGELVNFLESIGAKFGPDVNAYTSFDETVYLLQIPTDTAGLLDKGMQVLREWAGDMTLSDEEIDKERGVVLEEWRLGQGAQERLRKVHWPVLFEGSRYAVRLPIGKPDVIEHAPYDRIRSFYRTWYRPDLMAVIVVGAVDVDAMEAQVRTLFGGLENPSPEAKRVLYDVPVQSGLHASSATDPEQPVTQLWFAIKQAREPQGTYGAYRRQVVGGLATALLNQRLSEITKKPDPPFQFAMASPGSPARTIDMFSVFAFTEEGKAIRGLEAMLTEVNRAWRHGFTGSELDRAKAEVMATIEKVYNERDKTESDSFVGEYTRNFLEREPYPGIEEEHTISQWLLPEITVEEMNAYMHELRPDQNADILASGPKKDGVTLPTPDEFLAAAEATLAATPAAYVDEAAAEALMTPPAEPGRVVTRTFRADLGVTVVRFGNGVEVWLKPTDFKNDQILFGALARGGKSLADSSDYISASLSGQIVGEAGFGGHTPVELQKILAGKLIQVSPQIGDFSHGLSGSSTPKDLESALQLLVLQMTKPDARPESFTVLMDRLRTFLRNRSSQPEARFADRVAIVNHQDHYMYRPWTLETLDKVDPERARAFYERIFSDASDFRFYFVGSIDLDTVIPLLARYLGTLPSRDDGPSEYRDPHLAFPAGVDREVVRAGVEPKASTRISWKARASMDEMEMFRMRLATDILEIRLRELLREDLGSTYSVGVGYEYTPPYPGYAATVVSFGSAPENVDRMVDAVFEEVAKFKADGPTVEEVEKVTEIDRRAVQTGLQENGYWLASFQTLNLLGWPAERILDRLSRIDMITADGLRDTFRMYFPPDDYTVISLLPDARIKTGE